MLLEQLHSLPWVQPSTELIAMPLGTNSPQRHSQPSNACSISPSSRPQTGQCIMPASVAFVLLCSFVGIVYKYITVLWYIAPYTLRYAQAWHRRGYTIYNVISGLEGWQSG